MVKRRSLVSAVILAGLILSNQAVYAEDNIAEDNVVHTVNNAVDNDVNNVDNSKKRIVDKEIASLKVPSEVGEDFSRENPVKPKFPQLPNMKVKGDKASISIKNSYSSTIDIVKDSGTKDIVVTCGIEVTEDKLLQSYVDQVIDYYQSPFNVNIKGGIVRIYINL